MKENWCFCFHYCICSVKVYRIVSYFVLLVWNGTYQKVIRSVWYGKCRCSMHHVMVFNRRYSPLLQRFRLCNLCTASKQNRICVKTDMRRSFHLLISLVFLVRFHTNAESVAFTMRKLNVIHIAYSFILFVWHHLCEQRRVQ